MFKDKKLVRGPSIRTLEDAFHASGATYDEKAKVVRRLLDDPSLVAGRMPAGKGIKKALVNIDSYYELLRLVRGSNKYVPMHVATMRLGCPIQVVTYLRRLGHLECGEWQGRQMISFASLEKFDREFIVMQTLALQLGVSCKRIYARAYLDDLRILLVQTSQYTTRFLHRDDVKSAEVRILRVK